MKPLAVDLFAGLGGWTEGLLAEGFFVVGFDIERHVYGQHRYPAQLVLQDVLTIHGKQFKDASLIVASFPCQEFSYMAMPWSRAKQPISGRRTAMKNDGITHRPSGQTSFHKYTKDGIKRPGMNWSGSDKPGYVAKAFNDTGIKNGGRLFPNDCADLRDDLKCGGDWFSGGANASSHAVVSSRSPRRKMAAAMIAKIPLPVSRHIGRTYFPRAA